MNESISITNVLLGCCGLLLAFTLSSLWMIHGDMKALRVALCGLDGKSGLVDAVSELEISRGKHHVALVLLSGRISDLDGKPDIEL